MTSFSRVGLAMPTILLPKTGVDLCRWATVACDQYTAQPAYWAQVDALVGDAPSTLRLMLPEVYLGAPDEDDRIAAIQKTMQDYVTDGILAPQAPGWVLVERQMACGRSRKGLVVALDLEHYDFRPGAQSLIRPTEGTIVERLPPRVRVRAGALLELPHVMVLIDDPARTVIEPLFNMPLEPLYDTPLMCGGGHVRGFRIDAPDTVAQVATRLGALADPVAFGQRYGIANAPALLYAIGDGNHSVATAKTLWEQIKPTLAPEALAAHPARYVLAELVNIHDDGLVFEAIHRLLFDVDPARVIRDLTAYFTGQGAAVGLASATWAAAMALVDQPAQASNEEALAFTHRGQVGTMTIRARQGGMLVGAVQTFLDAYLQAEGRGAIDYVHGHAVLEEQGRLPKQLGLYLPALRKEDFFRTVIHDGALPRKTFSMGEADEKRFYLECRQIG